MEGEFPVLTKINFTFGSRQILEDIINKHPDRQFKLMQASTHSNKLALFDLSGKKTIFKSPVTLTVLDASLNLNFTGIFYYQSFQVNSDRQKLLYESLQKIANDKPANANAVLMTSVDNSNNGSTFVLLSVWNTFEDLTNWQESDSFSTLAKFTTRGSDNYYYDETYRPALQ